TRAFSNGGEPDLHSASATARSNASRPPGASLVAASTAFCCSVVRAGMMSAAVMAWPPSARGRRTPAAASDRAQQRWRSPAPGWQACPPPAVRQVTAERRHAALAPGGPMRARPAEARDHIMRTDPSCATTIGPLVGLDPFARKLVLPARLAVFFHQL